MNAASSYRWPAYARRWSEAEVGRDVELARQAFRRRRLGEPLARYLETYDQRAGTVEQVLAGLQPMLQSSASAQAHWSSLWSQELGRDTFRYLGAPPISEDDLNTLAQARCSGAVVQDPEAFGRLMEVMRAILDPRRFPWVAEGRTPSAAELSAAVLSTTTLMASQRVQTLRRSDEKAMVEGSVRGLLHGLGWEEATRPAQGVRNLLNDAPAPRTFLTQVNLGADNADVLIRLDDGRLLAIEYKGSNSEIHSRKRPNKEAAQNARAWLAQFGDQVVPAVALQGVFRDRYVLEAQDTPLVVFWGHRLEDLRNFVCPA